MGLKFRLFALFLLFALIGGIESRRSGGGSRSGGSRSGGSRSGGSRSGGSHTTHTSRPAPRPAPPRPASRPATEFHHRESTHTSNTGNYGRPATNNNPYGGATAPAFNQGNNNHRRPFGTVPPPRVNTNNNNNNHGTRPFGTVPPPRLNNNNNNNNHGTRPFGTVPPPKVNNNQKPPPAGFNIPHKTQTTQTKPPTIPGHRVYPTKPPVNPHVNRRPVYPNGRNSTIGTPGYRPHGFTNGSRLGFGVPSAPVNNGIQKTHNQGLQSGNPGVNYPRQPAYNPYPVNQPPPYSPYPAQHPPAYSPYPAQHPPAYSPYPAQHPPAYSPYPGQHPPAYSSHPVQHPPGYTQINNYHPLPPNPATTVVVVPGGGSSYGSRTTGDIFKEAIIHAGVNAAVNRLVNRDSYGHSYGHSYNSAPPVSQSTVTSTNTHIVNNNYYGQPSDPNTPAVSQNNNGQPAVAGVPSGTPNTGSYNPGSTGSSGTPGPIVSGGSGNIVPPTNGNSFSNGNNGGNGNNGNVQATPNWGVTDQELKNITEQLFNLDDNNGAKYIALNLQSQFTGNDTNITDASTGPLFTVDPAAYRIPTVKGIRSLYAAIAAVENKTQDSSQHEETLFVDLVLNTNVMTLAMDFLSRKNLVKNDYYEHKDILNHIWFTPYEENSSGFKRVFNGELLGEGVFWGLQDWTAFDYQEKANNTNYLSYVNKVVLGKSPPERLILKANYDIRGARKAGAALFVGISPELQMALYTICRFARPDNYCDVSLGGTNVKLFTHTFSYFGKDLIDAAFPVLD